MENINLDTVECLVNDNEEGDPVEIPAELAFVFEGFQPFVVDAVDEAEADDIEQTVARWTKYNRLDQTPGETGVLPANLGGGISLVAVVEPADGRIGVVMRRLEEVVPLNDGKTFNRYSIVAVRPMDSAEEARKVISAVKAAFVRRVSGKVSGFGITREERIALSEEQPERKAATAAFGRK